MDPYLQHMWVWEMDSVNVALPPAHVGVGDGKCERSLTSSTCIVGCGGGRKAGMITTQGESACSRQQAETPTGC